MKGLIHTVSIFVCALAAVLSSHSAWAGPADCECPDIAIKTNLVHDAFLTPDLGIEVVLPANFSISLTGTYAWWSNDSRHRYWRIRMGVAEARYWFGGCADCRFLTGHSTLKSRSFAHKCVVSVTETSSSSDWSNSTPKNLTFSSTQFNICTGFSA